MEAARQTWLVVYEKCKVVIYNYFMLALIPFQIWL